jgi:hypothetical protein
MIIFGGKLYWPDDARTCATWGTIRANRNVERRPGTLHVPPDIASELLTLCTTSAEPFRLDIHGDDLLTIDFSDTCSTHEFPFMSKGPPLAR